MTRELRDGGLTVGRHRIARLMRQNGLRARQKRRFKFSRMTETDLDAIVAYVRTIPPLE